MKHSQLAIQFYTLRDFCRTASDFAASCKRVRAIGYEAIQISGIGPIPENEIVEILKGEGLTCCATHEPADTVRKEPAKVVDRLQKLGVKYTAYPFPAGVDWKIPSIAFSKMLRYFSSAARSSSSVRFNVLIS